MKICVYGKVRDWGFEIEQFSFCTDQTIEIGENFSLNIIAHGDRCLDWSDGSVEETSNGPVIQVKPFKGNFPFTLSVQVNGEEVCFTEADVEKRVIDEVDKFTAKKEGDVRYRLYVPAASGPRPLLLYLHGLGEVGEDNERQLIGTFGPLQLAKDYPDCYILAPQACGDLQILCPDQMALYKRKFRESYCPEGTGWNRAYLADVCDIIRRMISEGLVDENRVLVTGVSMGGAGTLRALSVGAGLFAAAAPVCPSMTEETYNILCSLTDTKIWISTAYLDYSLYRTKYITDGIIKLKDSGNRHAHLSLFSPEEMAKYGMGDKEDIPLMNKIYKNHQSWILTYHNEHGIMDWLMSQHK